MVDMMGRGETSAKRVVDVVENKDDGTEELEAAHGVRQWVVSSG